jgi:hypothetical protein
MGLDAPGAGANDPPINGGGGIVGIEASTLTSVECVGAFTASPTAGSIAWITIGLGRTTLI